MEVQEVPVDTTVAFWQPAPPLYGSKIEALTPDAEGYLFAGGTGLYHRPPGGPDLEWERMPPKLRTDTHTEALGDFPLFESYGRVTSAGNMVYASTRVFLLRSRDHGENWTDVSGAIRDLLGGGSDIWGLDASDSALYVSMLNYGLIRSTDAGTSWERVLPDPLRPENGGESFDRINGLAITHGPEGRLYALLGVEAEASGPTRYGTLRLFLLGTERAGVAEWEELPAPPLAAMDLAVTPDGLYALGLVIEGGRGEYQLHHLPAEDDAWTPVPLPEWHLMNILAGSDGSLYTFGGSGLFRYDGGGTWVNLRPPAKTNDLLEHGGEVWIATDRGVFVTDAEDAARTSNEAPPAWRAAHRGIPGNFGSLTAGKADLVLGWNRSSVYLSRDEGLSWEEMYEGLPLYPAIRGVAADRDGTPLAVVSGDGLYRWDADDELWALADTSAAAKNAQSVSGGSALVTSAGGSLILAAYPRDGARGLLHKRDGGEFVPAQGLPLEGRMRGLAASPTGALFALIEADDVRALYRSHDDGLTWTSLTVPASEDAELQYLEVGADGTVYLTPFSEETALLRSRDEGATWDHLGTAGLHYTTSTGRHYRGPGTPVGTIEGHVLIETRGLVYYWSEAAGQWRPLLSGLPTTVESIELLPTGHLQASTAAGLCRSTYPVDRWIDAVANTRE